MTASGSCTETSSIASSRPTHGTVSTPRFSKNRPRCSLRKGCRATHNTSMFSIYPAWGARIRGSLTKFTVTIVTEITVRPLSGDADLERCARWMSSSEPWITLQRGYDDSMAVLRDPTREVYVAVRGDDVVGFVVLC